MCLELSCYFLFDSVGDLSASASDILSASLNGISKKEFIMMPPEEKLALVDRRAQEHQDKQEVAIYRAEQLCSFGLITASCTNIVRRDTHTVLLHLICLLQLTKKRREITVTLSFPFFQKGIYS